MSKHTPPDTYPAPERWMGLLSLRETIPRREVDRTAVSTSEDTHSCRSVSKFSPSATGSRR